MKRIILITFGIILTQYCYSIENPKVDSTKVEYQVCNNDTVYYKTFKSDSTVFCGLKQFEEEHYSNKHHIYNGKKGEEYLKSNFYKDKNRHIFCKHVTREILKGFGKDRCGIFLENYDGLSLPISIYVCISTDGKIVDLDFLYQPSFAEHMTNENIVRISKQLVNDEPIPFFEEYAKMGIKMIPPFLIPLLKSEIKSYLNE